MKLKNVVLRYNSTTRVYFKPTSVIVIFDAQHNEPSPQTIQEDFAATGRDTPSIARLTKWLNDAQTAPAEMSERDEAQSDFLDRLMQTKFMQGREWITVWLRRSDNSYTRFQTLKIAPSTVVA